MLSLEDIQSQIEQATKNASSYLNTSVVKALPTILKPFEQIKFITRGRWKNAEYTVVVTNLRVMFLRKPFLGNLVCEGYSLDQIQLLDQNFGWLSSKVTLMVNKVVEELESSDSNEIGKFVVELRLLLHQLLQGKILVTSDQADPVTRQPSDKIDVMSRASTNGFKHVKYAIQTYGKAPQKYGLNTYKVLLEEESIFRDFGWQSLHHGYTYAYMRRPNDTDLTCYTIDCEVPTDEGLAKTIFELRKRGREWKGKIGDCQGEYSQYSDHTGYLRVRLYCWTTSVRIDKNNVIETSIYRGDIGISTKPLIIHT